VLPAIDVMDIAIDSGENVLQLRDINLARAEEEACREIVIRIPVSTKLKNEESEQALQYANRSDMVSELAASSEPEKQMPEYP
jgi:hypothetical protein